MAELVFAYQVDISLWQTNRLYLFACLYFWSYGHDVKILKISYVHHCQACPKWSAIIQPYQKCHLLLWAKKSFRSYPTAFPSKFVASLKELSKRDIMLYNAVRYKAAIFNSTSKEFGLPRGKSRLRWTLCYINTINIIYLVLHESSELKKNINNSRQSGSL